MARRTALSSGFFVLVRVWIARLIEYSLKAQNSAMKRSLWAGTAAAAVILIGWLTYVAQQIKQQSTIDEARPADIIVVLGAAEYRGRPSPVLEARLNHALYLYRSEEHTSEVQSLRHLVCRLLLEKNKR